MNERVIIRYDSQVYDTIETAKKAEQRFAEIEKAKAAEQRFAKLVIVPEYNTIEKYGDGYVVTNKFDPGCNDKITPVTPGFVNYLGRSS